MLSEKEERLYVLCGRRLRTMRLRAGYPTQELFAQAVGIPRAQYGRYENGTNLTMRSLYRIVAFHQVTLAEFFAEGFETLR